MIDSVPLFGSLNERQRELIRERMVLEQRKAGEHLYRQGESARKLYLVKTGWVRLVTDKLAVLANLSQGSLLGDAEVLLGHDYGATAEALTDLEAWGLGEDDLADVVAQDPAIGLQFSALYRATVIPLVRYLVERRLRLIPGMDELPDSVCEAVAGRLCTRSAQPGETLFDVGQSPVSLFVIDDGRVSVGDAEGSAGEYGPGEVVAERSLLLGRPHTLTARAVTACRLWELSVADLEHLSDLYPDLRAAFSRVLQARLDAADQSRASSLLRATPIFQSLPAEALRDLASRLVWQIAPAGSHVFEAQAPADAMYMVEGGSVELVNQRDEPLARINSGGYFGEASLIGGGSYGFAAVARGNTTLWVLARSELESVAQRHPAVRRALATQLDAEQAAAAEHFAERHLRRLSLFAGLTAEQLRDVAGCLNEAPFRAGQLIYQRGQAGDGLYLVEQGRVSIQTRPPEGGVRVLATIGPGEFFGESALLTGEPHATDAFAQSDVSAWMLTRGDFETLLMQYPLLAVNLSRALSYRLRQSDEQVTASQQVSAPAAAPRSPAKAPAAAVAPARTPARSRLPERPATPAAPATAPRPAAQGPGAAARLLAWFSGLSIATRIQLVAMAVLAVWLIAVAIPSLVISLVSGSPAQRVESGRGGYLESSVLVALAANDELLVDAPATYTPWPTETPIPTPEPTQTPVPTATNTPLPTATSVPPTNTPVPPTATRVPPTQAPQIAQQPTAPAAKPVVVAPTKAPAPAAKPAKKYSLKEIYHLSACENGWNHNIYVKVVDPGGNPVDGVRLLVRAADLNSDTLGVMVTGRKGPGLDEIPIYKDGAYAVFVSENGNDPTDTDVATPLSSVRDANGSVWPEEKCNGDNGNTIGHNSFRVTFVKNS